MKRFFTFGVAAALALGTSTTAWSQASGGGASGGAGSSGAAGGTGTAGTSATAGTAATTGTTAGTVTTGTATQAGAASPAAGVSTGTAGTTGSTGVQNSPAIGINGRVNANAGLNNGQVGINRQTSFNRISPTPFFTDPGIQRQLNLNPNQFSTLHRAYQNAFVRYNQALNALDSNPNLTAEQRALQMQQLEAQFNQNFGTSLGLVFTNPQFRTRFDQLNRQFMGFNVFNDPVIRQQLNLTPDQVRQLRALADVWRRQLQQFRMGAGSTLSASEQVRWNQMWAQYQAQLNNILTPEQQGMWSQLVGPAYAFPPGLYSSYFGSSIDGTVNVDNPTILGNPNIGVSNGTGTNGVGTSGTTTTQGTQTPTTGQRQATTQGTQGGTIR